MGYLLTLCLFIGAGTATAGEARVSPRSSPKISDCFKVHSLLKMDDEHYWANWTNACPYTIDSVYVMVKFADRFMKPLGNGVWGLHFIAPGAHRVIRFSAPAAAADFNSINVHKITADFGEALQ